MGWDGMRWGKSAGGRRAQRIGGIGARSALDQQRIISGYFLRQGVGGTLWLRGREGEREREDIVPFLYSPCITYPRILILVAFP